MNDPMQSSLSLSEIPDLPAILMEWGEEVSMTEVEHKFRELNDMLDEADRPVFIVVDIRRNQVMPVATTFANAVFRGHRHPNLSAWLVVGTHAAAQKISNMLNNMSRQSKIQWFDSIEGAKTHINEQITR